MSRDSLSRMYHNPVDEIRPGKEHDDTTPPCYVCGEENIGINTEASLVLKGSFIFDAANGVSLFLVDPNAGLSLMTMPNGQLVIAADIGTGIDALHTECLDRIVSELFDEDCDDEEDLEDLEEIEDDDEL